VAAAPTAEEDAATLARAAELLRTDPNAYWRDAELQEAQYEALKRQEGAKAAAETPAEAAPPVILAAGNSVAPPARA
jgi:hypothetical protein